MKIAFASGKGGAGKTTFALSYHKYLKDNSVFADCDVDAADAFLIIEKDRVSSEPFVSGFKYCINDNCINCGLCMDRCKYNAISKNDKYSINPFSCEGCGACEDVCMDDAIDQIHNHCGELFVSDTIFETKMVHARLKPGEDNSGKLVFSVRKRADDIMRKEKKDILVIDSPPGIGCALMASITGIDRLVVIIEASLSGFSDAKRLITTAKGMRIPISAVINKSGLNCDTDKTIEDFIVSENIPFLGYFPFNREVVEILKRKSLLIDSENSDIKNSVINIFSKINKE